MTTKKTSPKKRKLIYTQAERFVTDDKTIRASGKSKVEVYLNCYDKSGGGRWGRVEVQGKDATFFRHAFCDSQAVKTEKLK